MGTWGLIQIVFDIFIGLGIFVLAMRISRQPKDDPRLSRGLQLLQAKIAVIEDLSDRTEVQVNQMSALLEQKCREVQNKVELADRHVNLVRSAMERSMEVANIFQDKIPHQEIIERQNTLKYLQAARLAHQGRSVDDIAQMVDLPKGELEFIAKVNREQLMFSEEQLPEWARVGDPTLGFIEDEPNADTSSVQENLATHASGGIGAEEARRRAVAETVRQSHFSNQQELVENLQHVQRELDEHLRAEASRRDYSAVFDVPKAPTESLARLGEEFRKVCGDLRPDAAGVGNYADLTSEIRPEIRSETTGVAATQIVQEAVIAPSAAAVAPPNPVPTQNSPKSRVINGRSAGQPEPVIKRVEFPRIGGPKPGGGFV